MIPRGRLDINYTSILRGMYYCIASPFHKRILSCGGKQGQLLCLSVRTGLDRLLLALDLPAGSEILVTAINIPDMFAIIKAHGLKAVALPVDKYTLNIDPDRVAQAISANTKAILITHLFGAVMDTQDIVTLAKANNLLVIEDCAQAFGNNGYMGNKLTDVVMYSFGLIKTHTTVSGAMLQINNPELFEKVDGLNSQLPQQPGFVFFKKLCKTLFIKMLTTRLVYTLLYKMSIANGKDFDDVLSGFTRGFPGTAVLPKIRYQPCPANLRHIRHRLNSFNATTIVTRQKNALLVLNNIPASMHVGGLNKQHSYWVSPIESSKPQQLIQHLRANGFDATQKASSLVAIAGGPAIQNDLQLDKLIYLPTAVMSVKEKQRLSQLISDFNN